MVNQTKKTKEAIPNDSAAKKGAKPKEGKDTKKDNNKKNDPPKKK
jgi:hypothetical protein